MSPERRHLPATSTTKGPCAAPLRAATGLAPTAVPSGYTAAANLTADDCQGGDSMAWDAYEVQVAPGETVHVTLVAGFSSRFMREGGGPSELIVGIPAGESRTISVLRPAAAPWPAMYRFSVLNEVAGDYGA